MIERFCTCGPVIAHKNQKKGQNFNKDKRVKAFLGKEGGQLSHPKTNKHERETGCQGDWSIISYHVNSFLILKMNIKRFLKCYPKKSYDA